jgi:hypothetical protein
MLLYNIRPDWMTRDMPPSLNCRNSQDIAILLSIRYLEENMVQTLNSSYVYMPV